MAGGLPMLPPGAMPPGGGPPSGPPPGGPPGMGPPPMAAMAAARPPAPPPGGDPIMQMILKVGLNQLQKTLKNLTGEKDGDKKTQAGGLIQQMGGMRTPPQNAMTPGGTPPTPPMLQGGQSPGFLALLAKLAAATQGRGQ